MSLRVDEALTLTHDSKALAANTFLMSRSLDSLASQMTEKVAFFKVSNDEKIGGRNRTQQKQTSAPQPYKAALDWQ